MVNKVHESHRHVFVGAVVQRQVNVIVPAKRGLSQLCLLHIFQTLWSSAFRVQGLDAPAGKAGCFPGSCCDAAHIVR